MVYNYGPGRTLARPSGPATVTFKLVCPVSLEPPFAECHRILDERTLRMSSASSSPSAEKNIRELSVTGESF
jgi:hypothetical protein